MDNTGVLRTADTNIICLLILIFIYFENRSRSDRAIISYRLFSGMVIANIVMIIIDMLSWAFNGRQGGAYPFLNTAFNFLLFAAGPVAPMTWLFYLYYLIKNDKKKLITIMRFFMIPLLINMALAAASIFTGWYFYMDALNVYHRGSLYLIHPAICYAVTLYSIILVVVEKNNIEKRYFLTLLLFFLPAVVGTLIQLLFYGMSLTWVGMTMSILTVFINIQNKALHTDFLTEAYNRRQLNAYLAMKEKSGQRKQFSAIMLDFDRLKTINDTFGHTAGDDALVELVRIIKSAIRKDDFVSRMGGDEFIIILDTTSEDTLTKIRDRILSGIGEFNASSGKAYSIEVSLGFGVYDVESGLGHHGFLKKLDRMMYADKKSKERFRGQAF